LLSALSPFIIVVKEVFSLHPEFGDTFPVNPNQFSSIVIAGAIWIDFFFLQCQAGFIKIFC
jgi:hypothetical protein